MEKSLQRYDAEQRLARWTDMIARCRSSGLTVKSWCEQEGISAKTYYYWQHRIYHASCRQSEFVEVPVMNESAPAVAVEISVNGIMAVVHAGADTDTIRNVLTAMKRC